MDEDFYNRLRDAIEYEPRTGILRWRKKRRRVNKGDVAGSAHNLGYIRITFEYRSLFAHRVAWLLIHGEWPTGEIDHINGIKTDNRLENLRLATRLENSRNRKRQKNNKCGVKGVSLHRNSGKWRAAISIDRKQIIIGEFDSKDEAALAYQEAASRHYGAFWRSQ